MTPPASKLAGGICPNKVKKKLQSQHPPIHISANMAALEAQFALDKLLHLTSQQSSQRCVVEWVRFARLTSFGHAQHPNSCLFTFFLIIKQRIC